MPYPPRWQSRVDQWHGLAAVGLPVELGVERFRALERDHRHVPETAYRIVLLLFDDWYFALDGASVASIQNVAIER